mmetsp:Transcript_17307/g.49182  ORF Transcript_17307/g.49182 Transcript_17307/m.49182 type:complete len:230 (+) Transcript_17307:225-914(+)
MSQLQRSASKSDNGPGRRALQPSLGEPGGGCESDPKQKVSKGKKKGFVTVLPVPTTWPMSPSMSMRKDDPGWLTKTSSVQLWSPDSGLGGSNAQSSEASQLFKSPRNNMRSLPSEVPWYDAEHVAPAEVRQAVTRYAAEPSTWYCTTTGTPGLKPTRRERFAPAIGRHALARSQPAGSPAWRTRKYSAPTAGCSRKTSPFASTTMMSWLTCSGRPTMGFAAEPTRRRKS